LLKDLEAGFALLRELPPAVTFFGGARIKEDDPAYTLSQEIGQRLAEARIPPRTGAGPGIMTSVPEGYKAAGSAAGCAKARAKTGAYAKGMVDAYLKRTHRLKKLDLDGPPPETQGIKIILPFEPETNESIDRNVDMATFPIRRLMLYENSLGLVVFPGGFGTLDELFEVWARRCHGPHGDPIVLVGSAFFGPLVDALRAVLLDGPRSLIAADDFDDVLLTDDPGEVVRVFTHSKGLVGFDEDPEVLARRLTHELPFVAGALRRTEAAVTFMGGHTLEGADPTVAVARGVLDRLAGDGVHCRVGHHGTVAALAQEAFRDAPDRLQGFFLADSGGTSAPAPQADPRWTERQLLEVSDPIAHKLLLTHTTRGFVVLPGDMKTLDEVFSVLCEIQTGKMERERLVLVGSDYWRPILDACAQVMLTEQRQTISPEDMELATVVDTVDAALAALEL
jgi:uncharacterized protein (TIGR00730 family)